MPTFRPLLVFLAALALSWLAVGATLVPVSTTRLDASAPTTSWRLSGFGPAATLHGAAGRWTRGDGRLRLSRSPLPTTAALTLAAPAARLPDTVRVFDDERLVATAELHGGLESLEVPIRPGAGEAVLLIQSLTGPGPGTGGVFLAEVTVQRGGWPRFHEIARPTLLWLALLAASFACASCVLADWSRAGRAAALVIAVSVLTLVIALPFRDELLRSVPWLALAGWTAVLSGWAFDRGPRVRSRSPRLAFALFAAGAALAVSFLFQEFFTRGWVLSQAQMLYEHSPWREQRPADLVARPSPPLGDVPMLVYPFLVEARTRIRAGEFPLWTTGIGSGQPFFAALQTAVLSPFTALGILLPLPAATVIVAAIKLLAGGLGMFAFLRRLGLSSRAAAVGGAGYLLNPFSLVWLEHAPGAIPAYLPWLLFTAHASAAQGGWWLAALALTTGLTALAGHPHTAAFVLMASGAYGVAVALASKHPGRALAGIGFALALGVSLAAVQVLPFYEYLSTSRGAQWRGAFALNPFHAPPSTLATALVPNFLGHHGAGNFSGPSNYLEQMAYPGMAVWVLALTGLWARRRDRIAWLFAGIAALALAVFYGAPGVIHLVSAVPLMSGASLTRASIVSMAAACVLAAFGAQAIVDAARQRLPGVALAAAVAALIAATLAGAFLLTARPLLDQAGLREWTATWTGLSGALAAGVAVTAAAAAARLIGATTAALLLLALVVGDLAALGRAFRPMVPASYVFPPLPELDLVRRDPALSRTLGLGTTLFPNTALVERLQDVRSYDGLGVASYSDLLDVVLGFVPSQQFHQARRVEPAPLLDLLNVKYLVVPRGTPVPAGAFERIGGAAEGADVYRNPRALPRAFLVDGATVLEGNPARRALRDARVDPRRIVILERELPGCERPAPAGASGMGTARMRHYRAEYVEVETTAPGSRLLVLTDTHYPGWEATVDGRAATIHRANFAFRAVAVPAGRHVVAFRYAPRSVRQGALVSAAALAGIVLLAIVDRRRRFP